MTTQIMIGLQKRVGPNGQLQLRSNLNMILILKLIKSVIIRTIIFLVGVGFCSVIAASQQHQKAREKNNVVQVPIRLMLQTTRTTWRSDEPIEVLAYLENVSQNKFFYVGRELDSLFSILPYHYIELSIKDSRNKDAPIGRMASAQSYTNESITEKLARAYIKLYPGKIYGLKDYSSIVLPPGRYRMTAFYREVEALRWSEEERKALKIPVWTERLVSNTITITVMSVK